MKLKMFANLRIRTQILIFSTMAASILLCIQICTLYFQFIISTNILESSSSYIINRQYEGSLSTSLKWMEFHISMENQQYIRRTWQMNEIFQFIQKSQIPQINDPNNCFKPENNNSFYQVFCFAFYAPDKQKDQKIEQIFQLLNLLDSFILNYFDLQCGGNTIFLSDTSEAALTAYFPSFAYSGFNPQTTPSYINHFKRISENPNLQYVFSPPYSSKQIKSDRKNLQQALTRSLTLDNGEVIGYVGHSILINSSYYDQIPFNILLVNQFSQIQMSSVEWTMDFSQINYFNNVSQGGFNQEDWTQIYSQSKNLAFQSNCSHKTSGKSICRYNQRLKVEQEIQSYNFGDSNQTLIIIKNLTSFQVINNQFDKIIAEIVQLYFSLVYWWIGICVISYSISTICLHFISKSWIKIMKISHQFVKQFGNNTNRNIYKLLNSYQQRKSLSSKFEQAFYRLYDALTTSQNKKCIQCQEISNFKYNFKGQNPEWNLLVQELTENLNNIKNDQSQFNIEIIQQWLRK